MKTTQYTGTFNNGSGNEYKLTVYCFGFVEAFFLLTAKAIQEGKHFELGTIEALDLAASKVKPFDINNFFKI